MGWNDRRLSKQGKSLQESIQSYVFKYNLFPFFQRADAAIADLTMTKERMDVVDFTVPFMNTGNVPLYCTIWEDLFTLTAHDFMLSFRGVNLVLEGWAASQCSLQY